MTMDLSVIIVNWNTKDYLLECIRSMKTYQGNYTLEIIVVDNASSDGSVSALKIEFPDVLIIANTHNLGFARANNQGLQVACGGYICLVNSDVVFIEDCFGPMLAYMDEHSEVGILGPRLLWADRSMQWSCRKFPSLWITFCSAVGLSTLFPRVSCFSTEHMGYFGHDEIKDVDVLVGAFLFVRYSAFSQVGPMDETYFMYCEELDWCKRFSQAGWKVRFYSGCEVVHYGGGSSSAEPLRFFNDYCLSNLKFWNRYHSKVKVTAYRLLMILRYLVRLPFWSVFCLLGRGEVFKPKLRIAVRGISVFSGRTGGGD